MIREEVDFLGFAADEIRVLDNLRTGYRHNLEGLDCTFIEGSITDRELAELGAVSAALLRLKQDDFGQCADCGEGIAFDRLKVEPWALRCVRCESQRERDAKR